MMIGASASIAIRAPRPRKRFAATVPSFGSVIASYGHVASHSRHLAQASGEIVIPRREIFEAQPRSTPYGHRKRQ
jgi:hypothetical protein